MVVVTTGVDRSKYNVCTTKRNEYGDLVAAHEIYDPETGRILYRCDHDHWAVDFPKWQKAYRNDHAAPEPMSDGHCMFLRPLSYGYLPVGETRPHVIRRAIRHSIVANLNGWDRELRKTAEGMRKLAAIVRATVNAKMSGQETGAAHFAACIWAGV